MKRICAWSLPLVLAIPFAAGAASPEAQFDYRHPRPGGYTEANAPIEPADVAFIDITERAGVTYDIEVKFPRDAAGAFEVRDVSVNGKPVPGFLVSNNGVFNGLRRVHGGEDFSVQCFADWQPGQEYRVKVAGVTPAGTEVLLELAKAAPAEVEAVKSLVFRSPDANFPYHHAVITLAKKSVKPGKVTLVEVDGVRNRDARYFNKGIKMRDTVQPFKLLEGESFKGEYDGSGDFTITVPCNWVNDSEHSVRVTMEHAEGVTQTYEKSSKAPSSGGYWNAAWPKYVSIVLHETVGIPRQGEPVHLYLGLMADDVTNAEAEIRVVTYDPTNPKAGSDGFVVAPAQVFGATEWRDEAIMALPDIDSHTGEQIHRYTPTTTVELVFFADMAAYQEKVYQVLYGNKNAEPETFTSDLKVKKGEGLAQTIENEYYRFGLSVNSGAVETVEILAGAEPVLLEHKLETNGAVHWNPGCYSPPTPWVHASDWENPEFDELTGPLMHRTRRFAMLPHMDNVSAKVVYTFYAHQPYALMSSLMEMHEDLFVQATRNTEIVFNHAVLDEFVWRDALGVIQRLEIESAREHPIHALEVPADTDWMAFVSREHKVGFAAINLEYVNTNKYGYPTSQAQPYIYVQNGPWIYWSRGLVYPFGGFNFTRMMLVRKGSEYYEEVAWVPFRFAEGSEPFADIERLDKQLRNPLLIHEWMPTDEERTPDHWIMPILTMPFDEGVTGAAGSQKQEKKEGE